jgi:DNA-binding response OmpR family regulator
MGERGGSGLPVVRRTPPSVLFVDPDVVSARQLADSLRARYAVAVVATAQQAWAAMQARLPTLVVLELDLPDATGLQVLAALQRTPATRHVLVVVLTARNAIRDKIAAFTAGADDYLVKPVDLQTFQTHLQLVMRFRKTLGE